METMTERVKTVHEKNNETRVDDEVLPTTVGLADTVGDTVGAMVGGSVVLLSGISAQSFKTAQASQSIMQFSVLVVFPSRKHSDSAVVSKAIRAAPCGQKRGSSDTEEYMTALFSRIAMSESNSQNKRAPSVSMSDRHVRLE